MCNVNCQDSMVCLLIANNEAKDDNRNSYEKNRDREFCWSSLGSPIFPLAAEYLQEDTAAVLFTSPGAAV